MPGPKSTKEHRKKQRETQIPIELAAWLAEGRSFRWIGQQVGINHSVVATWASDPEIQERVQAILKEADGLALKELQALKGLAVRRLGDVIQGEECEVCGRPKTADRELLKGIEMVLDRTGLPKTERQEIAGGLGVSFEQLSDAELERDILEDAAAILEERGRADLAQQVRGCV